MKNLIIPIYVVLMLVAVFLAGIVGYHFGKTEGVASERALAPAEVESPVASAPVPASTQATPPVASQPEDQPTNEVSPEVLAKERGIPVSVTNDSGEYTLVSVVEGAELNQKLSQNLQLVTVQRQQLGALAQQFDKAPADAVQQRELIAGKIHEVRNALNQNLQIMARGYGYTLSNSYLRVPYEVTLIIEEKVDEKISSKVIHEFKSSEQYNTFQNSNNEYIALKQQVALLTNAPEVKSDVNPDEALVAEDEIESPDPFSPEAVNPDEEANATAKVKLDKLNGELKKLRESMMGMYNYDPEKQYKLIFIKSALYARPA